MPLAARWRLLSLVPLPAELVAAILGELPVDVVAPAELTSAAAKAAIGDVDLLLGGWGGEVAIDAELIAAAKTLVAIQQPSVGVDTIDLTAAAERGIPVANLAGFNAQSVAEWCVGATFAALRLMVPADAEVRDGGWPQLELAGRGSRELAGARVGIVGFGAIGQACAKILSALGAHVGQWSRRQRDEEPWFELAELVARSEILIVVVALGEETKGLLSPELLATMPPGSILINAARGGIVDEAAVAALVRSGHFAAAAFDVYATEPLPMDSPLRGDTRIMLSPHAAGATRQSQTRLLEGIKDNIGRAIAGEELLNVVNGVPPRVTRRVAL
jgi:D-3-phosphoglycerate dehydrogenase